MSIRTERVAGEVQQSLARLFQTEFSDITDGMVTVTKVKMSPDLRSARVYLSVFGGQVGSQTTVNSAKSATPQIRAALAQMVRLRYVPELFFYVDDTQEEVARVEAILNKLGDSQRPPAAE
jgi:ribosome-binding factor A